MPSPWALSFQCFLLQFWLSAPFWASSLLFTSDCDLDPWLGCCWPSPLAAALAGMRWGPRPLLLGWNRPGSGSLIFPLEKHFLNLTTFYFHSSQNQLRLRLLVT